MDHVDIESRRLRFYQENYEIIAQYQILPGQRRKTIGQQGGCRYCSGNRPRCTFKSRAHTLPELIGNHSLLSRDECDSCNRYFGNELEPHLAAFLGASRTISRVRGKRGIPSYKARGGAKIVVDKDIRITDSDRDQIIEIDEERKEIRIKATRGAYVPICVFKSFVKMALAVMPPEELTKFSNLRRWLMTTPHSAVTLGSSPISAWRTLLPGPSPVPGVRALLLRRRRDDLMVPYMFSLVAFQNDAYMIAVHCPEMDRHLYGHELRIERFPLSHYDVKKYGRPGFGVEDLSGTEPIVDRAQTLILRFESMDMHDPATDSRGS